MNDADVKFDLSEWRRPSKIAQLQEERTTAQSARKTNYDHPMLSPRMRSDEDAHAARLWLRRAEREIVIDPEVSDAIARARAANVKGGTGTLTSKPSFGPRRQT